MRISMIKKKMTEEEHSISMVSGGELLICWSVEGEVFGEDKISVETPNSLSNAVDTLETLSDAVDESFGDNGKGGVAEIMGMKARVVVITVSLTLF
jgi:hypothetical protein